MKSSPFVFAPVIQAGTFMPVVAEKASGRSRLYSMRGSDSPVTGAAIRVNVAGGVRDRLSPVRLARRRLAPARKPRRRDRRPPAHGARRRRAGHSRGRAEGTREGGRAAEGRRPAPSVCPTGGVTGALVSARMSFSPAQASVPASGCGNALNGRTDAYAKR